MIRPLYGFEVACSRQDYILFRKLGICAVVAQPGRALDLFRGDAEDRAVVSSNLTDGISQ